MMVCLLGGNNCCAGLDGAQSCNEEVLEEHRDL